MTTDEPVDVRQFRRDDLVLDSLGKRRRTPVSEDPAARLLAALAADVDEQTVARRLRVGRLASLPLPSDCLPTRLLPTVVTRHARRHAGHHARHRLRRASRAAVVAAVAAGMLSTSGVAAALTGDALAPLRAVVSTVTGAGAPRPEDPAAVSGAVEQDLATAEAALGRGDIAIARRMLAQARQRLPGVAQQAKAVLLDRLRRIEERIEDRAQIGPAAPVVVPAMPVPTHVPPTPAGDPVLPPAEPSASPSPEPTAAEPTDSPTSTATPEPSSPPTSSPASTPTPSPEQTDPGAEPDIESGSESGSESGMGPNTSQPPAEDGGTVPATTR
jgi:hypothetical protein